MRHSLLQSGFVRTSKCSPYGFNKANRCLTVAFNTETTTDTWPLQSSKVSLGPNDSQERPLLLQRSAAQPQRSGNEVLKNVSLSPTDSLFLQTSTAANTVEQQDSSLAGSEPSNVPEVILSDNILIRRRVTLARLVKGVYELEFRRLAGIPFEENTPARSWWESVDFDPVYEFSLDHSIDLAVYKWNNSASAAATGAGAGALSLAPPCRKVVIAIRGTLPSMEDGWHNLHGSFQRLHLTPRFRQILDVVKRAADEHGSEEICITGHSLGASIGLLVARTLAIDEGIHIESHLFNPVYAYTWIPPSDDLMENDELWRVLRTVRCATVASLSNIFLDHEFRSQILSEYNELRDWTPHIYINTGDPICRGYWEYFSNHERLSRNGAIGAYFADLAAPFSGRGLLTTALGLGSKPSHLIPSAVLHVCEGELPRWPGTDIFTDRNRYFSHNLGNWMREDLHLHTREVKLSSW